MQVKKQQVKLDMEQQTGSKSEKGSVKAVYCHPAYLTSMQRNTGLEEAKKSLSVGVVQLFIYNVCDFKNTYIKEISWKTRAKTNIKKFPRVFGS